MTFRLSHLRPSNLGLFPECLSSNVRAKKEKKEKEKDCVYHVERFPSLIAEIGFDTTEKEPSDAF